MKTPPTPVTSFEKPVSGSPARPLDSNFRSVLSEMKMHHGGTGKGLARAPPHGELALRLGAASPPVSPPDLERPRSLRESRDSPRKLNFERSDRDGSDEPARAAPHMLHVAGVEQVRCGLLGLGSIPEHGNAGALGDWLSQDEWIRAVKYVRRDRAHAELQFDLVTERGESVHVRLSSDRGQIDWEFSAQGADSRRLADRLMEEAQSLRAQMKL